jgi:hypothetical protein
MPRSFPRPFAVCGAIAASIAIAFSVGVARGTPACAQTLPSPLVTFCAGGPALAQEINADFLQTSAWIAQKVGRPADAVLQVNDCVRYQVNASASGGVASARINAGDAACGAGRYPVTASCSPSTNGGVLDGVGISSSSGVPYAFCRTHGAGSGGLVSLYGACCRFKP